MAVAVTASKTKWNYEEETERIAKYREYEDFYHGDHPSLVPEKFVTVMAERLGIVDNFCSLVVDKGTSFLVGKALTFGVENEEELETWLKKVWKQNKMDTQMMKGQRCNGMKGDVFLKPWYDEDNKKIVVRILRPDIVFPKYSEEDYEEMLSCEIKFPEDRDGASWIFMQRWTPEKITEWEAPEDAVDWTFLQEFENKYKIMPIHVRNKILDKPYGESDLEDVIPLQKAFNKILTDIMKISEDQAFKHLWASGVRKGEEAVLEHGPGKLWTFASPDAKVGGIEATNIEQLIKFLEFLVQEIAHKGRVPKFEMMTQVKEISGVALRMMYGDMLERTQERMTLWTDCLRQLFFDLIKIGQTEKLFTGAVKEENLDISIEFNAQLPEHKKEQMDWIEKQVDLTLKSRQTAMKEIGIKDVKSEQERIDKEQEDEYGKRAVAEAKAITKEAAEAEARAAGGGVVGGGVT